MRLAGIALALIFILVGVETAYGAQLASATRHLLLEVWINGHDRKLVAEATEQNGKLLIAPSELTEIGIRYRAREVGADGLVDLSNLPRLTATLDEANQILRIETANVRLVPQIVDMQPPRAAFHRASAGTGLILDYDSVATAVDRGGASSTGLSLQTTGFTPWGTLTGTAFGTAGGGQNQFTRLDTTLEIDDQDSLRQWLVGDVVSGGLIWSRPVRFAGLHVGTDFSLEPNLVTQPLPQFFGQTTVPTSVDVFIDAAKVLETLVQPGPFAIRNLPVVTGGGTADVVMRDELGREFTQSVPYYTAPQLLTPGLFDYSFDFGALRRGYGVRSFDYANAVGEATVRYGLSDILTLESHIEASQGVWLGGGGGVLAIPPYGLIEASLARSYANGNNGSLLYTAMQSETHPISLFASYTQTSEYYADVGSIDALAPARQRLQAGMGISMDAYGSLAFSWIEVRDRASGHTQLATASYSLSLGGGLYLGVTGVDDVQSGNHSAEAFISIPLGGGTYLGGSVSRQPSATTTMASLTHPANPDGGWGYGAQVSAGNAETAEADATWVEDHGRLDAGVATARGQTAARLGASGALILMDGSLYASHTSNDAFALVQTGTPGVEIYRENRPIARSGPDGEALVPDLNAYEENRLSVEPRDYPMSVVVTDPDRIVVPRRHSGVAVDFSPTDVHAALVTVRLEDGSFPMAGTEVRIDGRKQSLVIGHGGQLFIENLTVPLSARIALETHWCRFKIVPPTQSETDEIPRLPPVTCRVEADDDHAP
ncbi:MAG: hypothetical protein B7Z66_15445 [Chromatiales bacterium 21-64-14]|nr:MAG: hypothetical protein B7Z66_15445 [Chromatiales bacterium 21-64-14]